jgi:hypothetical protein
VSSSKLQTCLKLCQFIQTLLKTKVVRRKTHFLIGISKRPLCIIHQNGWSITRDMQPKRRMLHLESHCYNKSDPGPKAIIFPNLDERKSFLICFETLLDLPKHCLHIVHSQPSVLLGLHPSLSYSSSFLMIPLPT